jgi:hypothetical protein
MLKVMAVRLAEPTIGLLEMRLQQQEKQMVPTERECLALQGNAQMKEAMQLRMPLKALRT